MTLDRSLLQRSISHLFESSTMPKGATPSAVMEWASAYSSYANAAIAGGTMHTPLIPVPGPNSLFFDSMDSSFRSMWMTTVWTGPSLVGTTLFVPSLSSVLRATSDRLVGSRDPRLALTLITEALHTYTLGITVTVVPPSGTPATVPLT